MRKHIPVIAEGMIERSRYLLVAFYLTCVVSLAAYVAASCWQAMRFIGAMFHEGGSDEASAIGILGLLDRMMVANVIFFIIAGSYLVYVKPKFHERVVKRHLDRPQALQHLSPGGLKEKMAASLIGVSSVNLLTVLLQSANEVGAEATKISTHQLIVYLAYVGVKIFIHAILIYGFVQFYKANIGEEEAEREDEREEAAAAGRDGAAADAGAVGVR